MLLQIHSSAGGSYALIICMTEDETKDLHEFSQNNIPLEAVIEHTKLCKFPHIKITIPKDEPERI